MGTSPSPSKCQGPGCHCHHATGRDGSCPRTGLGSPAKGKYSRKTHLPPKGNKLSPNTLQHTYTKGGRQTLKKANPSSYFGNSQSYSEKKSSYLHIFLSGSTTDRTGQILLIKTQEIFFSSGYQSTVPCYPKQTHHTIL